MIQLSIVSGPGDGGRLAITLTDYDMVGRSSANVRVARGGGSAVSAVLNVVQAGGVRFAGNIDVVSSNLPGTQCLYSCARDQAASHIAVGLTRVDNPEICLNGYAVLPALLF